MASRDYSRGAGVGARVAPEAVKGGHLVSEIAAECGVDPQAGGRPRPTALGRDQARDRLMSIPGIGVIT